MSNSAPAVAVLNLPGLAHTLASAGLNVMGDGRADTKSTIELLRTIQKSDQPFVIIAAIDDPSLRSWATLHASMGAPVLIARSEMFIRGDNIPASRIIELPCTVAEIMANFGATLDAKYGDVEIGADGRVVSDVPPAQPTGDPFNVFGAFTPPTPPQSPEVTSTTSDDDVFGPARAVPVAPLIENVDTRGAESPSEVNIFANNTTPPTATRDDALDPADVFQPEPELPPPLPDRTLVPLAMPVVEAEVEDHTDDDVEVPETEKILAETPDSEVAAYMTSAFEGESESGLVVDAAPELPPTQALVTELEPEDRADDVFNVTDDEADIIDIEPELPPTPPRIFAEPASPLRPAAPARQVNSVESVFTRTRPSAPTNERRAKVVAVFAGKGGVGKSTSMLSLAERAATVVSGLRVIAVDANRGQGDLRTFLKLDDAGLPSIYDAAVSHNPDVFRDVLVNPKKLSASRVDRASLHVGVILSPEKDQSDPSVVTSQVYARAIEYARSKADLVFIDTQIIESFDTSGLIDDVIVPLLLDGAWGLGLADTSTPGVQNLMWVLNNFVERGVSTSRLMVALNKVAPDSLIDASAMARYVSRYATWMGVAVADPLIERTLNLGEIPGSSGVGATPEFTALLDRVLQHVTGLSAFSQVTSNEEPAPTQTASPRRFWSPRRAPR